MCVASYKSTSLQRNIVFPCSSPNDIVWTTMFDQRMTGSLSGTSAASAAAVKISSERTDSDAYARGRLETAFSSLTVD